MSDNKKYLDSELQRDQFHCNVLVFISQTEITLQISALYFRSVISERKKKQYSVLYQCRISEMNDIKKRSSILMHFNNLDKTECDLTSQTALNWDKF